jgi:hypothetical protein
MTLPGRTVAIIAVMAVIGTLEVKAADFAISRHSLPAAGIHSSAYVVIRSTRPHVVVHRYRIIRKSIGMLCVLPPHAIVQLNWNGPQCRWVDNIMQNVAVSTGRGTHV